MSNDKVTPITNIATWAGAGLSSIGAVTVTEWLAIGGFCLAVCGFIVNLWHKRSMIKIERERLEREFPTVK